MQKSSPAGYSLGLLGTNIMAQSVAAYLLYFYVDRLGLAVGLAATARTLFAIVDALDEPLWGYLSDRTRTRFGRRRPWLVGALLPYLLSFVLLFAVPRSVQHGGALFWYFAVVVVLYETVSACVGLNYAALYPELFRTLHERARVSAYKEAFNILSLLVGVALTPVVYNRFGFAGMALLYAAAGGVFILISVLGSHEDPAVRAVEPMRLAETLGAILRNRPFWIFSVASALNQFVLALLTAGLPFWARYTLGLNAGQTALLFAAIFVVAIPMVPVWAWLTRRLGARRAWILSIAVLAVTLLPAALAGGLVSGITSAGLTGLGFSGMIITDTVVRAELVDGDKARTGRRREGIYYGVTQFCFRIAGALQGGAFALIGLLFGYVSGQNPGLHPALAFRFLMVTIPLTTLACSLAVARAFRGELPAEPQHSAA